MSEFVEKSKVYMDLAKIDMQKFKVSHWIYLGIAFIFAILDLADAIRKK